MGFCTVFFCTRPTKNGGLRCATYFLVVPECVTKCDRGRGSKLSKNSVTYFMDGPILTLMNGYKTINTTLMNSKHIKILTP